MDGDIGAVRDALTALDDALDRGDLQGVLSLCTNDVLFIGSGEGEEAVGRDAVGPMFAALGPELEGHTFSLVWESVDVDVLGEVALLFARGSATLTTSSRHDTFGYRLTGVLVRDNGRWLWRVHHGSEPGAW